MITKLFHATRRSKLESILENGLLQTYYGDIHGKMEYHPPENAVYLSTNENSGNLNADLFNGCEDSDYVIVLAVDATLLSVENYFPDDAFFYLLDRDFCADADDLCDNPAMMDSHVRELSADFCSQFGLDVEKGSNILRAFCESDGSMAAYAVIARSMGLEYACAQGEVAYLGNVPASAILGWSVHPGNSIKTKRISPG